MKTYQLVFLIAKTMTVEWSYNLREHQTAFLVAKKTMFLIKKAVLIKNIFP